MALAVERAPQIYEGSRIPSPIPTVLQVDPKLREEGDILEVNFGPNHPSTHGVLRLVVELNGERVVGLKAVVGYLHTGFEKNMEQKTWWKAITYPERIDYLSFQINELVFVLAIEKLLGVETPPKATWMRMLLSELSRIHSHLIWLERTKGLGLLSAEDAIALGQSGPVARASGIDWDLRRDQPHLAYDEVDFAVPVYHGGDVYDRYKVHMDEMRESVRIVQQCLDGMPDGRWIVDDRKLVLPPREELHTSMETLIHHFKLVTEGYRVPEGEVYVAVESARGELGCYVVSDGGPKPWRVKFRAPSLVALEATATCMSDALVADLIAIVGSLDTVMGEVDR